MVNPDFSIANKLEVLPGNVINLPGCEPTTSFTSPTLARNMSCKCSQISLVNAMAAIPEATVVYLPNANPPRKFFVLPSGPPPQVGACTCDYPDWYQKLRDACEEHPADECPVWPMNECNRPPTDAGFNFSGYMKGGAVCGAGDTACNGGIA